VPESVFVIYLLTRSKMRPLVRDSAQSGGSRLARLTRA